LTAGRAPLASVNCHHDAQEIGLTYNLTMAFDPAARVWYVQDSDVPGLATKAETIGALHEKHTVMVPELIELNSQSAARASFR
jgi:hypothetical protein